jgi:hypothetical protein
MTDIQQRNYYKIFTGTNQAEGYDKVHLGYEAETSEIDFKKDSTTFFHIPFFANTQNLSDSTLIADGAIPGPIPALADRIFKKLGGYGNSTSWGNTTDREDGTWLCSWLYAVSSEPPQWLDRYYNPGRLAYEEALEGRAEFTDYIKNDPIYYDVPSTLTLEPGVLYQYFHNGEETALSAVETFAGVGRKRLRLNIDSWSHTPLDDSIYNNTVTIDNFNPSWVVDVYDPGYRDRNALSFDNNSFINCKVSYSSSYNLEDEFTLSFWTFNNSWANATSTQLIGNLRKGGYGVFYNNLNDNPYFVIPETYYGHLFYCNQEGNVYNDKNVEISLGTPVDPISVNINSNSEIITLDATNSRLFKYNHLGDVITTSKEPLSGLNYLIPGVPKLSIIDRDNNTVVITTSGTYTFDKDLLLKTTTLSAYRYKEQIAFDITGNLVRELSCFDIKFDSYNNKWTIKEDGNLYCNDILIKQLTDNITNLGGTNLAIDPEDNLWVLANSNLIYKFDTKHKTIIDTYEVGVQHDSLDDKNISFIKSYNRSTNTFTWYAFIVHNYEQTLYQVTLDGNILRNTLLTQKLNILDPATALQDKELLRFTSKGDFTGYEWRRIFNKVLYNNNSQLQFKVAVKSPNTRLPNSIYTLSIPANYFLDDVWHLVTVSLKNHIISIYVDNYLRDSLPLPGNLDLNYEFKNDIFIGCPCGKSENLNTEIASTAVIWNGYIDSVRIYDYAIDSKFIQYFVREKTYASDIVWNIPTAALQYVEIIDRFFKHRLPGSKSVFFNIRLTGTKITDSTVKTRIENDIKLAVQKIKPAYTELLRVEWID